jgi:hypothetical protein
MAVKSDGGSSSYYEIHLPVSILEGALLRYQETGKCFIETEDIIHHALGNDFDRGNIFKCLKRITSLEEGQGKDGNSALYDANKVVYSANKVKKRYEGNSPTVT